MSRGFNEFIVIYAANEGPISTSLDGTYGKKNHLSFKSRNPIDL